MSRSLKERQRVYTEIEKERYYKIAFMCRKCVFFIDEKCTKDKCVNDVKGMYVKDEESKNRELKIKIPRLGC